jgi:hypothetical protein
MSDLSPEKAFIFRVVHVANVPWILGHGGLFCRNSPQQDRNYINIGSIELIEKRSRRVVLVPPGGTLSDYVPFYFTPFSMMMYKIKTGHGGITKRNNKDIVIFVSSIHRLRELGVPFLFTNQHAYPPDTDFYETVEALNVIDWALLQSKDFKTDDADPGKQLRYQAEALVHDRVPLDALLGIVCYSEEVKQSIEAMMQARGQNISVKTLTKWYF